jgi:hypothetical protein
MKSRLEQFNPRKTVTTGFTIGRPITTTMPIDGVDPISQTFQILMLWIYHQEELV